MKTKLKPTTTYDFSKEDLEFAIELAKVGYVSLMSHQIKLVDIKEAGGSNPGLSFKEYGDNGCDGLKLPDHWVIEGIYTTEKAVSITFGVKKSRG